MNKLEIIRENLEEEIHLKCSGRLDAYWAGQLKDYIDAIIREGYYYISIDMNGIDYISSGGIRILLQQYHNLKKVQGSFRILSMSDNVKKILEMVGLLDLFFSDKSREKISDVEEEHQNKLVVNDFRFIHTKLSDNDGIVADIYGDPELFRKSEFVSRHSRRVESMENHYGIGLGAIGESFEECENRFGEYVLLGKNIAYMPADGFNKPDFMLSAGKFKASLMELYGLHFKGDFTYFLKFEQEKLNSNIGLSEILETINRITDYKHIGMVMLAESAGLIGVSLKTSPVQGKKVFGFPEIAETFNFTTEHKYKKMLTLSVGCFSFEVHNDLKRFLRPVNIDSSISGHIHSTVFPYIPVKKREIDLDETIEDLFNSSELTDVMHLINDSREIMGLGESQFTYGYCWIVPIKSINNITTQ